MTFGAGIRQRTKRAIRREDGTATVEFVILFPALMILFLSFFEISVLLLRTVILEQSLDVTVRELRLGILAPMNADQLRAQVCSRAPILQDCENSLLIELQPISTDTWSVPNPNVACREKDAEIQPVVNMNFGIANDVMLVRACAKVDPFFAPSPWIMDLLPVDGSNQYAVVAASTFVNEP